MNITLDDAIEEMQLDLKRFRTAWIEKNIKDPNYYPLVIPKDNSGLWLEFFLDFMSTGEL